ncbi:MAG: phosphotransferase enzyme family protein [Candidatus Limivicinus sp.]|jgi:aminoglycoside phosphotransferase (APT) family kinase protein
MKEAINHFPTEGRPQECRQIKSGHINETYLITTDSGVKYILQWINHFVFPNVDALMHNMTKVNRFLREEYKGKMATISYLPTIEEKDYYDDGKGGYWRAYRYVDNSMCMDKAGSPEDFYESAAAFGRFLNALSDFPAEEMEETIADFHNTAVRFSQLRDAVKNDVKGRLGEIRPELDFALAREEKACALHRMRERGELPVRVTHNDTKINNVLFDADTRKAICVIDLDTVMPGLSAFDFGDAIRFGANTAAEDERELDRVCLDPVLYRAFTRGFLEAFPGLTEEEIDVLPQGAYTMTIENGIRFLADYLNGDVYYSTDRAGQNLDRCRTQFRLLSEMEKHRDDMLRIVGEERARLSRG